jgi:oligoribonuclease NrnB/cAMP/cGMP phosphodiesterase (DHH superfamily)
MSESRDTSLENALIVTHYDLDGFVCALCLLEAFNIPTKRVRFVSYGTRRAGIIESGLQQSKAEVLYLCDIGLSQEELGDAWAMDPAVYRVLFDHHEGTGLLDLSAFHEAYVDRSGDACSSDLVLEYLRRRVPTRVAPKLMRWVAIAHDRDLWLNENREVGRRVTWLLKERIHERLDVAILTPSPEDFLWKLEGQWKRGETLFHDAVACAQNTACVFDDAPVPIKIAYVKRDTSDVADELQEGGQLIVLLNVFGQHVGVSLRTDRDDVNAADIARRCFGGGGHRLAASGFASSDHLLGGYRALRDDIVAALRAQWQNDAALSEQTR